MRIYSLGCDCIIADACKVIGCRESGPVDWASNVHSIRNIRNLLSGAMLNTIMNKSWVNEWEAYPGMLSEHSNPMRPNVNGYYFIHEDLNNSDTYKKVLYRFLKFEHDIELVKKDDPRVDDLYFMYRLWEADKEIYDLKFIDFYLKTLEFPRDRLLILSDTNDCNDIVKDYFGNNLITIEGLNNYWSSKKYKSEMIEKISLALSETIKEPMKLDNTILEYDPDRDD